MSRDHATALQPGNIARLHLKKKEKKKKTQMTKNRNKSEVIITNLTEIKGIMREYYEQLYVNK